MDGSTHIGICVGVLDPLTAYGGSVLKIQNRARLRLARFCIYALPLTYSQLLSSVKQIFNFSHLKTPQGFMKTDYAIIDGHGHILPMPNEIPDSIISKGYFDIVGAPGNQFMTQKFIGWKRPVSNEIFFIQPRLEWMQKNNIAHTVMLTLSQFYCNGIKKADALEIIKFQNDFHLKLQDENPKQITAGFVVQPLFIDEALLECEQRVREGLKILCLPTHYVNAQGKFSSCTDETCCQLYAFADKHNLAVQIHPYDYEKMIGIADIDAWGAGHITAMLYLTGHFHYQLTCANIDTRFPNARFCLSHGNTMALFSSGRKNQWRLGRSDFFNGVTRSAFDELQAPNIFFDTIVHDPMTIRYQKEKCGTTQLVFGTDLPYPLADGVHYVQSGIKKYPTYTLDGAEEMEFINPQEKYNILRENGFRWLYSTDKNQIENAKKLIFG